MMASASWDLAELATHRKSTAGIQFRRSWYRVPKFGPGTRHADTFILLFPWTACFIGCSGVTDPSETGMVEQESYSLSIVSPEPDCRIRRRRAGFFRSGSSAPRVRHDRPSLANCDWLANGNNLP